MCGRFSQKSPPTQLGLKITSLVDPLDLPLRYNGSPGQEHWVIRQNPKTGERTLDRIWWGLIPHWCKDEDCWRPQRGLLAEGGESGAARPPESLTTNEGPRWLKLLPTCYLFEAGQLVPDGHPALAARHDRRGNPATQTRRPLAQCFSGQRHAHVDTA